MTDLEIAEFLRENGYPEHVAKAGKRGLIARYERFVDEVEKGYRLTLDDYRNDLDLRGILAQLGLDEEVREADGRFRALLTGREYRIWESAPGDPFWDFGYPKNAAGELREDLEAEGLL